MKYRGTSRRDADSLAVTEMEWYGLGTVALIGLAFYAVRRIQILLAASAVIVGAFTVVTYPSLPVERRLEWFVITAGLLGSTVGLLIVRIMLIRSVSLQLLARIDGAEADSFQDDIRDRLNDLRAFHLVHNTEGGNTLTPFGQLVAGIVAASYWALRIKP
jgi:hypothetical protein